MSTPDDPRDEYDFRDGTRGSHHRKLRKDGAVVRLDPDVAERFPTSESVNTALRALARESSESDLG
jgi:hypothetical protein